MFGVADGDAASDDSSAKPSRAQRLAMATGSERNLATPRVRPMAATST